MENTQKFRNRHVQPQKETKPKLETNLIEQILSGNCAESRLRQFWLRSNRLLDALLKKNLWTSCGGCGLY